MDRREGVGGCGLDSSGSGMGPVVGSCQHGNVPSGFMKGREFLDQLNLISAFQRLYSIELGS
jgi:hypothetical protein